MLLCRAVSLNLDNNATLLELISAENMPTQPCQTALMPEGL